MIHAALTGKTALVTGGASGVGLATVTLLARCGARVAMNHRPGKPGAAVEIERLRAQGLDVISAPGDVSKWDEGGRMVATVIERFGRLDILVNNAATPGTPGKGRGGFHKGVGAITEEWWQEVLATNLLGPFRCTSAAADALKEARGAVINVASIGGIGSIGSNMVYGVSKAALIRLTSYLSRALAPAVRVNAVAPGFIDTPWTADWPAEIKQAATARTPLQRACTPEDVAEAILFFSAGAALATGQTLIVDGGML